jgi:ribosome-associated heat shock protein Hsp15
MPFGRVILGGEKARLDRQRIDKWLWHARVVRARTSAAELANDGRVRVNGQKIDAASRPVKPGDVITIALDRVVRILRVRDFAERRGSAEAAQALFEDMTPPVRSTAEVETVSRRDAGSGRPTKWERRAFERLHGVDED